MYQINKVCSKYYDSIKEYRLEMIKNGSSFDGCNQLQDYEDIEKWDLNNRLFESYATCPPGYSLGFQYLYTNNNEVIGMINIRPKALNHPFLKMYGGHIGYSIKPSYRNKGIGKTMLGDFLKICAKEYKLDKVLLTCLKDNIASKKIIEENGGIFIDEVIYTPLNKPLLRFWIHLNDKL